MLNENSVVGTTNSLWVVEETKEYYEMKPATKIIWDVLKKNFGPKWFEAQKKMLNKMPCYHVQNKAIAGYMHKK